MPKTLYICVIISGLLLINCSSDRNVYQKREHSLVKPYSTISGFGAGSSFWDFGGNAMITGNHIRLTSEKKSEAGYLWNNARTGFKNWELHLHFKIKSTKSSQMGGDGLALWYTKDRMEKGGVFGAKNTFVGLGVFLDTFANDWNNDHKFPQVSAMVSNGDVTFNHDKDGVDEAVGSCFANVRDRRHETFLLVRYENRKLTVKTDVDDNKSWAPCFQVDGVSLPKGFYFGLSSATGDLFDNHDVISLKVFEIELSGEDAPSATDDSDDEDAGAVGVDKHEENTGAGASTSSRTEDGDEEVAEEGGGSWFKYFLALVVLGLIVGVVIYFRREDQSKRFY